MRQASIILILMLLVWSIVSCAGPIPTTIPIPATSTFRQQIQITFDPTQVTLEQIITAIKNFGFPLKQ